MKRIRCFAAVFCLLLLLAGCAGEPKVKRTIEGMKTYAEMTDGTWTCDGRSYAYRLEIRGRLSRAACDSVFVYLSNVPEISFERAAKAPPLLRAPADFPSIIQNSCQKSMPAFGERMQTVSDAFSCEA